jgi:hypothetical protein
MYSSQVSPPEASFINLCLLVHIPKGISSNPTRRNLFFIRGLRGLHGLWFGGVRQGRRLHFQRKDFYKQACSILFFSTAFALQFTPNPNKSMIISTRIYTALF